MATIITKISLNNFFNYYGSYEENTYEFKNGINIVVADNGAGKSKLFNALLWVFYDELLDSDTKTQKGVKLMAVKIISDLAKKEAKQDDTIDCGVKIEFEDNRFFYEVEKSFSAYKLTDSSSISDNSTWEITEHESAVSRSERVLRSFKQIYDINEKKKIINKLIRPDLRQYSFFQGEEVEKIIDFSNSKSIKDAIRKITDINKVEEIEELSKQLKNKAEKDYDKKSKENVKNREQLEKKLNSKEKNKKKLDEEIEKLSRYKITHAEAKQESSDLEDKIQNSEKKIELKEKRKALNKQLRDAKKEYQKFLDGINQRFFDGNFAWVSMGLEQVPAKFMEYKSNYIDVIADKKALRRFKNNPEEFQSILPVDMPDTMSLNLMLKQEHCHVCNRKAEKGSEAWNYMNKLKNRPVSKQNETPLSKNNFKSFFEEIQLNSQPFTGKLNKIQESIINSIEKLDELKDRISRINSRLKTNQNELKELFKTDVIYDSTESERNILNAFEGAINRANNAEHRINNTSDNIKELEKTIKGIEEELKVLIGSDVPVEYEKAYELLNDISTAITNTRSRIFKNMLTKLEEFSNKHFKNLIKYNQISGGKLSFKKTVSDTIELDVIDENGNIISGNSEGFQRMKKLAVVMAIISAKGGFNYPLFADAPLSTFGIGFIKSFFEEVPQVYPQSIILINNIYDEESENKLDKIGTDLLKSDTVSTMYLNQIAPNVSQIDIKTEILKLK